MIVVDYDQFSLSIKVDPQLSQDLHKQDWCTIGQHARAYPTLFQHFIHMLLHKIKFICTELILFMVQGWYIFINKVNGIVKRVMWS